MAIVTVAGVTLPDPSIYVGTTADVVDTGRNAQGVIVSDVVRHDVAKIEMTWNYLTLSQWANILGIFHNSWANSVTYLDQTTGSYQTRTMYVGDRKTGGAVSQNGQITGWRGCQLALIEV